MDIYRVMQHAVLDGTITEAEHTEWLSLISRLAEVEDLERRIQGGAVDPEQGMSQSDIALCLGISQQAVSKYMKSGLAKAKDIINGD